MTSKLPGIYLSYLMALIASNIISFGYSMLSFYLQTVSFKYPILCYITYLLIVALIFFATGYIAQKHLAPPKKASLYFLVFLSITVVTITLLLLVDFFFPLYIINAVWFQIAVQTVNFINKAGYSALPLNVIESIIRHAAILWSKCGQSVVKSKNKALQSIALQWIGGLVQSFPLKTGGFFTRFSPSISSIYSHILRKNRVEIIPLKNIGTKVVRRFMANFRSFQKLN